MIVSPAFSAKKFAVLGLARSGLATVASLHASGAHCLAWDNRDEARCQVVGMAEIGDPLLADLTGYAGVVVSPGVPLNRHPIVAHAASFGVPVIGDIELFAMARADLPPHRVVGITGTNGKSTTTALVDHLVRSAALPCRMGGNIGLPILAQEPLRAGGVYVLELSSYQIDLCRSLDCDVAALTNITPDHLDRYDDGFAGYRASKARLFAMQSANHHAVFGNGDDDTRGVAAQVAETRDPAFIHLVDEGNVTGQDGWPSLQGPHNRQNVAVATAIVEALGISERQWRAALPGFKGLPHRMERVAEIDGVLYVNDSKATNPASTAPALGAFPRIHWIVGGLPKGDGLDDCMVHIDHVVAAYTIGDAGPAFADILQDHVPVVRAEMMGEAVYAARAAAQPGDVIMLSPACASFDQFRDFEARGDFFRQIVASLESANSSAKGDA